MSDGKSLQLGREDGEVVIGEAGQDLTELILLDLILEHMSAHWRWSVDDGLFLDLPRLVEAELRGSLTLLEDQWWLGRRILVVQVLVVLGGQVLKAALYAPGELEEGPGAMLESEAGVVRRAELLEVDASCNFDDISVLNDSSLHSYSDGRYVREAAPEGDGVLE